MNEIRERIRDFVVENFLYGQGGDELCDDDSLLEKGAIDSTGVLELVTFLESQYCIQVEDEELVPDNLDSIERIVTYVVSKLASPVT